MLSVDLCIAIGVILQDWRRRIASGCLEKTISANKLVPLTTLSADFVRVHPHLFILIRDI